MTSHIDIIVPVYNTEAYLRPCLDSLLAQSMHEIRILCVNDGATDGSPAILAEYSRNDPRISVVNRLNGGLSAARNTGLSHVLAKYVLFVDSDDWIHPRLCEEVYQKAEGTDAEIVQFGYNRYRNEVVIPGKPRLLACERRSIREKTELLTANHVWSKLWRSDFICRHGLTFPEGLNFEDIDFNWRGVVLAEKIVTLSEPYYYYRNHGRSIVGSRGVSLLHTVPIFERVERFLREANQYEDYRDAFLAFKLTCLHHHYKEIREEYRAEMKAKILQSLKTNEQAYLREGRPLKSSARSFHLGLLGNSYHRFRYAVRSMIGSLLKKFFARTAAS